MATTSGGILFDIKVIDTDAPSHYNCLSKSVLKSGANQLKRRIFMSRPYSSGGGTVMSDVCLLQRERLDNTSGKLGTQMGKMLFSNLWHDKPALPS